MTALYVYSPWFIPVPGLPPVPERVSEAELRRVHDQTAASVHAAIAAGIDVDVAVDVDQPAAGILDRAAKLPAERWTFQIHRSPRWRSAVLLHVNRAQR